MKAAAVKTPAPPKLFLHCPYCGEHAASIDLRLYALDEDAFHCGECDAEFSIDDVEAIFAEWLPVLAWVRQAPSVPDLPPPAPEKE